MLSREQEIVAVLKRVDDPELPSVSVWDLGMVYQIQVHGSYVEITMVPTFAGCPALDFIELNVKKEILELGWVTMCTVNFTFKVKWSTDKITNEGKKELRKHGVAPPPENFVPGGEWSVNCPYCDSPFTSLENIFGPTACRSILYCPSCKNPFEAMKPVIEHSVTN
ncbi:1,2-phenylacetyl-CoA epoxidase subunit PaaD [Halobacillus rhizosphaerae]|uniref:1,2-phenylacetyl-CoA epoxidase subunit PaaD n=1 Tax=Halobacillus rhizosphaerae TaxID=3064889 RepID=UPI00398A8DF4